MYQGTLAPTTNHQTWTDGFELIDGDTSELLNLTGAVITLKVSRCDDDTAVLSGSTITGEVTIAGLGLVSFRFGATQLGNLCPGTYAVTLRVERNGDTDDVFVGSLPVLGSIR